MAKKNSSFGNIDPETARAFARELANINKELSPIQVALDSLTSTFFGISGAAFFKETPKSLQQMTRDTAALNEAMSNASIAALKVGNALEMKDVSDGLGGTKKAIDVIRASMMSSLKDGSKEMRDIIKKMKSAGDDPLKLTSREQVVLAEKLAGQGFEFLDHITDQEKKAEAVKKILKRQEKELLRQDKLMTKVLASHRSLNGQLDNELGTLRSANDELKKAAQEAERVMRSSTFMEKMANGLKQYGANIGKDIMPNLKEFDQAIHDLQKSHGVMMVDSSADYSHLTTSAAQYGMGIKDVSDLVGALSDELRTTDAGLLIGAVEEFKSLNMALGITSAESSKIAGELMRAGGGAEDVTGYLKSANKNAKMLGVSSKNVVQQISKNIERMRSFGFEGGVKSLTLMAAKAEKLGIQVDSIFNVAERARTIEGAMEMAAQLQLAGGSFAQINPMELLSAARNNPEELQKILTKMGSDLGHWSKDMKSFDFNPIDADRIKIAAEASNLSVEEFQSIIRKNAILAEKTKGMGEGMFSGAISGMEDIDAEMAKSMLGDFLDMKDGVISLKVDRKSKSLLDAAGIKSVADLNEDTLHNLFVSSKDQIKSLEEQAEQNKSLTDSFAALTASLTNLFTIFQPVLEALGWALQQASTGLKWAIDGMNKWGDHVGDWVAGIGGAIVAGAMLFKVSIAQAFMYPFKKFGSLVSSLGNVLTKSGGVQSVAEKGAEMAADKGVEAATKGGADIASNVSGTSKFGSGVDLKGLAKLALGMAMIGAAIAGFIFMLNKVGGAPGVEQLAAAAASMVILGGGVAALSMIKVRNENVVQMALAMGIIGAAMIPFAYAMNMMKDVDWKQMLASVGIMTLSVVALAALGALLTGPQVIALGVGALALIAVGASMALAGAGFMVAASAMEKLSGIEWGGITKMGSAMLSAAPGMLAFGVAAMAFANPIAMVGMGLMTLQLMSLSMVMVPLAAALLTSSDAMNEFVAAMGKMKSGVRGVDLGGVFDGVANALERMNEVLEDSDMSKITKALSSIRVNIDASSIDGLKSSILAMPALVLHVDKAQVQNLLSSISSIKVGIDMGRIEKDMASLPAARIVLDAKSLQSQMAAMPAVSVKFDLKALTDALSNLPVLSIELDQKSLVDLMTSAPVIESKLDVTEAMELMRNMPELKVGVDKKAFSDAVLELPIVSVGIDAQQVLEALGSLPAVSVTMDVDAIMSQLLELPAINVSVDIQDLMDRLSMITDVKVGIDVSEMTQVPPVSVMLDVQGLKEQLSGLPAINVDVDMRALMEKLSDAPKVMLALDPSELLRSMESLPTITVVLDTKALTDGIAAIPSIKVEVDTESAMSFMPKLKLVMDEKSVQDAASSIPNITIGVDPDKLNEQLSRLPSVSIELKLEGLELANKLISDARSIEVKLDATEVMEVLEMMRNAQFTINADDAKKSLESLASIQLLVDTSKIDEAIAHLSQAKLMVDASDVDEAVSSISKARMTIDTSAIDKAIAALSSAKLTIDASGINSAISSLSKAKLTLDTTDIDKAIAVLSSAKLTIDTSGVDRAITAISKTKLTLDMDAIMAQLSSIPKVEIVVDMDGVMGQLSSIPKVELAVDTAFAKDQLSSLSKIELMVDADQALRQLSSIPKVELALDATSVLDRLASMSQLILTVNADATVGELLRMTEIKLTVDASQVEKLLSLVEGLSPSIDLTSTMDQLASASKVVLMVDASQAKEAAAELSNIQLVVDIAPLRDVIASLNGVKLTADVSSVFDQLKVLPKITIDVDRSEVDKMAALLSSIRVALDVSALESSISGLKVSVDTAQLDQTVSDLRAIDMSDISRSLASIEAKISKKDEGPASNVKVVAEDLGASSNKLQAEMMVRLAEAIERLSASSSEKTGDRKITIDLEMDGRSIKSKILKDTSIHS